jgi:hypothetical protein
MFASANSIPRVESEKHRLDFETSGSKFHYAGERDIACNASSRVKE